MAKNFDFEASLRKIEEINIDLEKGNLTLEESLKIYEEGVSLASKCYLTLEKAELKIVEINKNLPEKLYSKEGEFD